jgi:tRNA-uridine 2-sulfurtransferase
MLNKKSKKIIVALSGGVDSAVAAALLKKQGFDVAGAYMRFFPGSKDEKSCEKAKKIAKKLDIPIKIIDAQKEFKKRIIDYFVSSYKNGLTPNPCVVCNKEMKFRLILGLMKKYKFDYVATGHYARIKVRPANQGSTFPLADYSSANSSRSNLLEISQGRTLREAKDKSKDQSYFLYRLSQKELSRIIFPLGYFTKDEVRKIAKKLKLPILAGEESQDICFLQKKGINDFLGKYIELKQGNIIDENGKILGKHKGLPLYTIGQRKGIEIGASGPYFVAGKNIRNNELTVTNDSKKLLDKSFRVGKINWINKNIKFPLKAKVQIRYHAEKFPAIINLDESGSLIVKTNKPLRAVTPGQSVVFYKKNEVLGGGIIK